MTRQRTAPTTALTGQRDPIALLAYTTAHDAVPICRAHWREWFRSHPGAFLSAARANGPCVVCAQRERAA